MMLTELQKERIGQFAPTFKEYLLSLEREDDLQKRLERSEMLGQLLSRAGLERMTELEFGQVISSLWASQIWGNKGYLVDRLITTNGLPLLISSLRDLLWGDHVMPHGKM